MRRFFILDGDKTSAGGVAIASQNTMTNMGRPLVMIGDTVICSKCNSTGPIIPIGPRRPMRVMGREPALDRDRCLCKCPEQPWLINSRTDMSETMTTEEVIAQGFGTWVGYKEEKNTAIADSTFNDKFILKSAGGQPVAYKVYAIERASGSVEYGKTTGAGHTHLLSSIAASEKINFYVSG